ncbi:MAG: hypothetical protein E7430_04735 [Ruminococcaceae bacterium]|nr:hypothetical protein [Oscillospiraceae bacterium]
MKVVVKCKLLISIVLSGLMLLMSSCGGNREVPKITNAEITAADFVQKDGKIAFPYAPPELAKENFSLYMGISYEDYSTGLIGINDLKDNPLEFSFYDMRAVCLVAFNFSETVETVLIQIIDDGRTGQQWSESSEALLNDLSKYMQPQNSTTDFISKDGKTEVYVSHCLIESVDSQGYVAQIGDETRIEFVKIIYN